MAANAKSAAITRSPVVRFSQSICGNRLFDAASILRMPQFPLRPLLSEKGCFHEGRPRRKAPQLVIFSRLSLDGCDCDRVDDVARCAAAGEVVRRFVQSLENRADRRGARQTFG